MRIGNGFDVHQLTEDRKLIIGGVTIPYPKGLLGHSDADVLCHAIADSLLGAAALGDIGRHFPDNQDEYKNISSLLLLEEISRKIEAAGYQIINIDSIIMAQKPKMLPYIEKMRRNIAQALRVAYPNIGIKATTTEKLGFVGREEGIAASAVALLQEK